MAFTNYILQSVICTTIFYAYGFGLFARVDRAWLWAIVFAIWVVILFWSSIWMRFFRIGPLEWIWRAITYGTVPGIRGKPSA